jgi:outer membrane protein assembly factor BamB
MNHDKFSRRNILKLTGFGVTGSTYSSQLLNSVSSASSTVSRSWYTDLGSNGGYSSPAVINNTIYIGGGSRGGSYYPGAIYAIDASSGDIIWSYSTDSDDEAQSSPVVTPYSVYYGSANGKLYSFNRKTGDINWEYETSSPIVTAPTSDGQNVYVYNKSGQLYKINAATGELKWEKTIIRDYNDEYRFGKQSPLVVDDTIYIVQDETYTTGNLIYPQGRVEARKTDDGTQKWVTKKLAGPPEITYYDGLILADAWRRYAIESESGSILWKNDDDAGYRKVSITAANDSAYTIMNFSNRDKLQSLDVKTGDIEWEIDLGRTTDTGPTVVGDTVIVGLRGVDYDGNSRIDAFDINTGEKNWDFLFDGDDYWNSIDAPMIADDGKLYVNIMGNLNSIDIDSDGSSRGTWAKQASGGHNQKWIENTQFPEMRSQLDIESTSAAGSFTVDIVLEPPVESVAKDVEVILIIKSPDDSLIYEATVTRNQISNKQTITFGEDNNTNKIGPLPEGEYKAVGKIKSSNIDTIKKTASFTATIDTVKWEYMTSGEIHGAPTIVNETVYVGCKQGNIYALDSSTGEEKWVFKTPSNSLNSVGNGMSSINMVDGTVFIGRDTNEESDGPNVYAIDAETGEEEWVSEFGSSQTTKASPTVTNNTVFIPNSSEGKLYALDGDTGKKQWESESFFSIKSSPTIAKGDVFIGSYEGLCSINIDSGKTNWIFEPGSPLSSPTVTNDTVITGGRGGGSILYAVDLTTGNKKWEFNTNSKTEIPVEVESSPTVAGDKVFIGDQKVYAVDLDSGEKLWSFKVDQEMVGQFIASSPTVADGTVFIKGYNKVYALNANNGNEKWSYEVGRGWDSSPTVVDGTVFIGGESFQDGERKNLHALNAVGTGSSDGTRTNLGTLGHHGEWNKRASTESTESSNVELTELSLNPSRVDGTNDKHTLSFKIVNLSPDSVKDDISIALPDNINVNEVSFVDKGGLNPEPEDPSPENPITFNVNPSGTTGADMELELALSLNGD